MLSFVASILLTALKFFAFYITSSNAILSDALESIINVIASGFAFYSVYLSSQPKDRNHPYGHGKVEFFSAGFEGALIIIASIFIVVEAVKRLMDPAPIENLAQGSLFIVFTHRFGPTANRLCADRTYITPSDKAGVAINNSPIELVAMCAYFRPAVMTRISPSSFER